MFIELHEGETVNSLCRWEYCTEKPRIIDIVVIPERFDRIQALVILNPLA